MKSIKKPGSQFVKNKERIDGMRSCLAIASLCLLITVTAFAQKTQVDWDHGTHFSQFHTFTWATGAYPIQDPDANLGFSRAVQDELARKGVHLVPPQQKFDVFVTYNAQINPDPQESSRKLLRVSVRIFDSRNNNVVWRAGGFIPLVNDGERNRSAVHELIAEMFQKYPPSE